jgi:hypothetical protein
MEIYAELNSKLMNQIEKEGYNMPLPNGVTLKRKKGSRSCFFECDDSNKDDLIDFLDSKQISWQYNDNDTQDRQDRFKEIDPLVRNNKNREIDPWVR